MNIADYPLVNGDDPLVMTNRTMENGPFIGDVPIQIVIFHSYVNLPEGKGPQKSRNIARPVT